MKRNYGWKPDIPDQRDYAYKVGRVPVLPTRADLRPFCPPVQDQGELGACTAHAIVAAMGVCDRKSVGRSLLDYSRLFLYYAERAMEGTVRSDAGAFIRDGIKVAVKQGVCAETLWPYDVAQFRKKPSKGCYGDAMTRKAASYQRIGSLSALRSCLAEGFPVVFGFSVYESFESDAVARSGMLPMPEKNERMLGGHAVLAVGYDDAAELVVVRNSWGETWGTAGYFHMPYKYITNRSLSDDFWTLRA